MKIYKLRKENEVELVDNFQKNKVLFYKIPIPIYKTFCLIDTIGFYNSIMLNMTIY